MEPENKKPKEPEKKEPEKEPEKPRMVEDANIAAKRLEEANKVMSANLDRQEALAAEARLGGKADAGGEPAKPEEESPSDYAKKVMEGEDGK